MVYVYCHATPDGVPFYVGKGTAARVYNFDQRRGPEHAAVVKQHGRKAIRVFALRMNSDDEARICERMSIELMQLAGFPLINQISGGGGSRAGWKQPQDALARMRASMAVTMATPEFKAKRGAITRAIHTPRVRAVKADKCKAQWADPAQRAQKLAGLSGYRWINNGTTSKRLWPGEELPDGWSFGRSGY